MTRTVVSLGPAAGIAYLEDLFGKLESHRDAGAAVPGIERIRADLRAAGQRGAIPARVEDGRSAPYLWLYVDARYALNLEPTTNGRGYLIRDVRPMRMRDIDQIVRDSFALRAGEWDVYDHPGELLDGLSSRWEYVQAAWRTWQREGPEAARDELPVSHAHFLDALKVMVDRSRELELAGTKTDRVFRYRGIEPVAAQRRNARSVHKFLLMPESDDAELRLGVRVFVAGRPDMRGTVRDIAESLVRVAFERTLHFDDIPLMGEFVAVPDMTTFDRQAEAIGILRMGGSRNPALLTTIVDRAFQPFAPAGRVMPREQLNREQLRAFKIALNVPDLALVQGPPGTGKTRTIKQVIRHCSANGTKMLVTAYTNQAVDNVLKHLDNDLTVIRVGDGVTDACAHLTLDEQAKHLRQRIAEAVDPVVKRYATTADPDKGEAVAWLRLLERECAAVAAAAEQIRVHSGKFDELEARVTGAALATVTGLSNDLMRADESVLVCSTVVADLTRRQALVVKTAEVPIIGRFVRSRQDRLTADLEAAITAEKQARRAADQARSRLAGAEAALAATRATHPALGAARAELEAERARCAELAEKAAATATLLRDCLPNPEALPMVVPMPASLEHFHTAAQHAVTVAARRLQLLASWRAQLGQRSRQLNRELLRYADVVGATCIGTASNEELAGLDFELAIVDEAGQVNTPNLLVPLVRANRAILVGDHVQLPPYCERELRDWAQATGPEMFDLTTKSTFEMLYPQVPRTNRQMLTDQHRMPEAVARFINAKFYNGDLDTKVRRPPRDDLFVSTMALVNTGDLKDRERCERRPTAAEAWPKQSFVNDAEAEIMADFAAYYHARGSDWVVIVPFSAQKGKVIDLLSARLGSEEVAASRVASVDSFQGGERDTVIFGFTRSNADGRVGFLDDLRRINVAFSRAKKRLIIVGDLTMLCRATDAGVAELAQALREHLRISGDLRGYRQMQAQLAAASDEVSG